MRKGVSRIKKGSSSISKKSLDKLRSIGTQENSENKSGTELEQIKELIATQNAKIRDLESKLTKNQEIDKGVKVASKVDINELTKFTVMSQETVDSMTRELEVAVRELEGHRNTLISLGGGDYSAYETKTGNTTTLKNRIVRARNALVNEAPPKITPAERDKLYKRYEELSDEIRGVVSSERDQWDTKNSHGHFQDAIDQATALSSTYSRKVLEWQNIGKILDPSDKRLWSVNKLRSKHKN